MSSFDLGKRWSTLRHVRLCKRCSCTTFLRSMLRPLIGYYAMSVYSPFILDQSASTNRSAATLVKVDGVVVERHYHKRYFKYLHHTDEYFRNHIAVTPSIRIWNLSHRAILERPDERRSRAKLINAIVLRRFRFQLESSKI